MVKAICGLEEAAGKDFDLLAAGLSSSEQSAAKTLAATAQAAV